MKDNKFKTIVETAYSIIDKYNFDGANISRIVRASKVSSGVIYRNFGTKENFYRFLYYEALADYIQFIDKDEYDKSDIPGRVALMSCAIFEFTRAYPHKSGYIEKYRAAHKEINNSEDITRDFLKELREDVRIWIEEGRFVNIPVNSIYDILIGSMMKLAMNSNDSSEFGSFKIEEIAAKMVNGFLRSY